MQVSALANSHATRSAIAVIARARRACWDLLSLHCRSGWPVRRRFIRILRMKRILRMNYLGASVERW
ncbi:MAG TPA: hypothetical protein VHM67_00620, partial [Gemmatimonadaceae bacterium]|nr:hypothetical protein [Gemmatimonadaceae bacterium]